MKLRRHNRGITLVELLVSISIGLVIIGAMVALYIGTASSYRQLEALAQLQSNARYVFESMGYDIRMAGNMGCHVPALASPDKADPGYANNWWSNIDQPLRGFDETADSNIVGDAGFPQTTPGNYGSNALRGDSIVVLRANPDDTSPGIVANYKTGSPNPIAMSSGRFNVGSLLLLTDCKTTATLFQMTGEKNGIQHNMSAGSGLDMTSAKVVQLSANAYYLRNSGRKYANSSNFMPSLYRQTLTTNGGLAATEGQELVSGVTDLQIRYGIDDDGNGVLDRYVDANGVSDWGRVVSVRVTITLEAADDAVTSESASFTLGNGAVITDRRLRRSYTMTFGIRQRLS